MKNKSYYSKIIFSSLALMMLFVLMMGFVFLSQQYETTQDAARSEHAVVISDLAYAYEQLQDDHYRVLMPLFDTANSSTLKKLFSDAGKENLYTLQQDLISLCDDICLQDKRIQAIYFYSADESRSYFYSALTRSVEKMTLPISTLPDAQNPYQRAIIGARKLNIRKSFSSGFDVDVIGIQSPSLPLIDSGAMPATRTVIFYSLDSFDDIVEKYRSVSSARYYITSTDGIVLYDSAGEYAYNENTYCNYFSDLDENADVSPLKIDDTEYLAGCTSSKRDSYRAGFLVSRNSVFSAFRQTSRVVLAVMLAFCVLMSVVFLCSNRLIGQRFEQIEIGMREIGHQRLDYRLSIDPRRSDEFTRIARKFNQMCDELQDEIDHNYTYQMLQKTAEYKALQTSINPHFLYNSLEILRERLEESEQSDCAEMVVLLSRFFEYQMRGESIVDIQQELRALQSYIELLSIKSQYIFEYELEIDEKVKEARVPKLILQPLFENYYIHGLRSNGEDFIRIRGSLDASGKFIYIDFCDNGKGIAPERIIALNDALKNIRPDEAHIGLQNVNNRLRLMFGAEAGVLLIPNEDNIGINVRVFFPRETENRAFQPRSTPDSTKT